MAFSYDPNATNMALQAQGSSYRLPTQQPAAQAAPAAQPAPAPAAQAAPAPAQPTPDEVAGQLDKPTVETDAGKSGLQGVQSAAGMAGNMKSQDANDNNAAQKLGGLIGTVLSAYTGNAQGVAGGISNMQGNAQAGQ